MSLVIEKRDASPPKINCFFKLKSALNKTLLPLLDEHTATRYPILEALKYSKT